LLYPLIASAALACVAAPERAAWARDCPSTCSGYLFAIGDSLEMCADLRLFYLGIDVGQDLPTSRLDGARDWQNNVFIGLRPLVFWYPADGLTIAIEHEARYRWPGWEENVVPGTDWGVEGLDERPTLFFIEYETHGVTMTGGLQPFSFGSSAVLDQRFMGLQVGYEHDVFNIAAFGGLTMRNLMRNATHSMWMSYQSDTNGWKFVSNDPSENWAVGMSFSLKNLRPFRLQLLYLYSSPSYEHLESHGISLHFSGPIMRPYMSFSLEPVVMLMSQGQISGDLDAMPGLVAEVRARFGEGVSAPELLLGVATSFLDDEEHHFASVFENLSWGMIRRFNLRQGDLIRTRFQWQIVEYVRVYADYILAIEHDVSDGSVFFEDELDAGLWVQWNDLYRLNLAYVGLNLAREPTIEGRAEASHGIYAEVRIVIGEQPE
jgi:hypothetical protein